MTYNVSHWQLGNKVRRYGYEISFESLKTFIYKVNIYDGLKFSEVLEALGTFIENIPSFIIIYKLFMTTNALTQFLLSSLMTIFTSQKLMSIFLSSINALYRKKSIHHPGDKWLVRSLKVKFFFWTLIAQNV